MTHQAILALLSQEPDKLFNCINTIHRYLCIKPRCVKPRNSHWSVIMLRDCIVKLTQPRPRTASIPGGPVIAPYSSDIKIECGEPQSLLESLEKITRVIEKCPTVGITLLE